MLINLKKLFEETGRKNIRKLWKCKKEFIFIMLGIVLSGNVSMSESMSESEVYTGNVETYSKNIEENIASKIIEKSKKYKLSCIIPNYYDNENIIFKNEKEMDIYINLCIKIKKIINSWDPLKIMDISFSNEYSYEIKKIIGELLKNITIQNLRKEINKIFKSSYNGIYKIEKNEEIKIAQKIFEEYNNISKS